LDSLFGAIVYIEFYTSVIYMCRS